MPGLGEKQGFMPPWSRSWDRVGRLASWYRITDDGGRLRASSMLLDETSNEYGLVRVQVRVCSGISGGRVEWGHDSSGDWGAVISAARTGSHRRLTSPHSSVGLLSVDSRCSDDDEEDPSAESETVCWAGAVRDTDRQTDKQTNRQDSIRVAAVSHGAGTGTAGAVKLGFGSWAVYAAEFCCFTAMGCNHVVECSVRPNVRNKCAELRFRII